MALGAVDRDARERADRVGDHIVAIEVASDLAVGLRLGHLTMADQIPGAGGDKSDRLVAVGGIWMERVTGDLLFNELGVWLVGVEGTDDVVAVGPGIGPGLVLVVAVGVAVVDNVEPVAGPPLAVLRRGEQPIDELFGGRWVGIGDKGFNLFRRRW